jgi:UDPglucose 6-dehydrogenase
MTYKPWTDVVEASQGIALARVLLDEGFSVTITDPAAAHEAATNLGGRVVVADSAAEAVVGVEVVVIMTPWPQFREIPVASFRRGITVIDPWHLLTAVDLPPSVTHVLLGRGAIA